MRQASSHESHEELPNPVDNSYVAGDQTRPKNRTEPEITITGASASSHESADNSSKPVYSRKRISLSAEQISSENTDVDKSMSANVSDHQKSTTSTDLRAEDKTARNVEQSLIENETFDL